MTVPFMSDKSRLRSTAGWLGAGVGAAAGLYAAYAGVTWARYGHVSQPAPAERDELLDRFMPVYEVVERHHIRVGAPADVTLAAAGDMDLFQLPVVRAIFKGRELILGSTSVERQRPHGLLVETQALGWRVLADVQGREIVLGAVTKPWEANPTFRPVTADEFVAFAEPDYVKIVWNLRADPTGIDESIFRTETRAVATDGTARAKFRRYWSFLSPGISLIRWMSLRPTKAEAERRTRGPHGSERGSLPSYARGGGPPT